MKRFWRAERDQGWVLIVANGSHFPWITLQGWLIDTDLAFYVNHSHSQKNLLPHWLPQMLSTFIPFHSTNQGMVSITNLNLTLVLHCNCNQPSHHNNKNTTHNNKDSGHHYKQDTRHSHKETEDHNHNEADHTIRCKPSHQYKTTQNHQENYCSLNVCESSLQHPSNHDEVVSKLVQILQEKLWEFCIMLPRKRIGKSALTSQWYDLRE